ncbi:hypothetical protein WISP_27833 [Willisornis vidua]|uniref:Uncharacterized protein n=1 Tax=Willisornis vidua TaxID=1566151 RepID=A0ABQ9DRZ1_9PASS|nr:hypothetical protein WISP_27833 [Willisornis vidua]
MLLWQEGEGDEEHMAVLLWQEGEGDEGYMAMPLWQEGEGDEGHMVMLLLQAAAFMEAWPACTDSGAVSIHVLDIVLGLVENPEVHISLIPKLVQVLLDDMPSFRHANHITQLCVFCKPAECALDPSGYVNEDIIQYYWSQ